MELLGSEIARSLGEARNCGLSDEARALGVAWADVAETPRHICKGIASDSDLGLANASVFLEAFGHTVVAWLWLRQVIVATIGLRRENENDVAFYRGKLQACRWFYRRELPKVGSEHRLPRSLDDTLLAMDESWF